MTPFIVISTGHNLLPFAYRLQNEGRKVQVAMVHVSERWYEAWGGKFDSFLRLPKRDSFQEDKAQQILEAAEASGAVIITDSHVWGDYFQTHMKADTVLYPSVQPPQSDHWGNLCLGWWQGIGGSHLLPHVLFQRTGLWPGDAGPNRVPVAGTARFTDAQWVHEKITAAKEMIPAEYTGLVQVPIRLVDEGVEVGITGIRLGWNPIQTHLVVGDLPDFAALLDGSDMKPELGDRFVCGTTVSIPPWPLKCSLRAREAVISGIPPEETKHYFFHDMRIVDGQLMTVGLDGLVAVARGSARNFRLASMSALNRAAQIVVPEKQFRPDAFEGVDSVVGLFESLGMEI